MTGPLAGIRVIELASIGPGPFCGMVLADHGADVIRVDRPGGSGPLAGPMGRGRRSVVIDLKREEGQEVLLRLVTGANVMIEGFRPGVTERLGVGPAPCLAVNPRLVYGRMTGWGQEGPLAVRAGHDIDYIALAGVLHGIGREGERPVPPLNLVADYGGGGMLLAFGVVAALLEVGRTGRGQVVDAAMVEGAALLAGSLYELRAGGAWSDRRGTNLLDGGAPFYDTYLTADGEAVAVGALEPQFYAALLDGLGLSGESLPDQLDRERWPELRRRLAETFRTRTRDEWAEHFAGTDACVAPVLSMGEAPSHHHLRAREVFTEVAGVTQAGPAPRFSGHPRSVPTPPPRPGQHTDEVMAEAGYDPDQLDHLSGIGVIGRA